MPFHRQYVVGGLDQHTASGRDRDIGLYVAGHVEADVAIHGDDGRARRLRAPLRRAARPGAAVERRNRAPLGFSYLLTKDAKNVLRGSYVRIHQQLMGTRHPVAAFGGDDAAGLRDIYDANGDGMFETGVVTPPRGGGGVRASSSIPGCTSRSSTSSRSATAGSSRGRSAWTWPAS